MSNTLEQEINKAYEEVLLTKTGNVFQDKKQLLSNILLSTESEEQTIKNLVGIFSSLSLGVEELTKENLAGYVKVGKEIAEKHIKTDLGENVDNISNFFLKLHSAKTDDEIINVLSKSREILKVSPGIGQVFRLKEEVVGFKDIDDVVLELENQRPKPRM